jgi:thiamine-monophosphate kinase
VRWVSTSEFAKIAQIDAILRRESREVSVSIGDDCAVLAASDRPRVWTVDSAVEGVHFSRAYMALTDIAQRAFAAAASDVAAMGGRAVAALSALTLPAAFGDDELTELVTGLARAADVCFCPIVGGNLARGCELSITTSVLGECPGRVLTRKGAQAGDGVFVTGTVGGAALGFRALSTGHGTEPQFALAIEQFLTPRARLDCARQVAEHATAAIDVSDGVVQDLEHLCRASGVGARIEAARLPWLPGFALAAGALSLDPLALALEGGEDYQLLFTAPRAAVPPTLATYIGAITAGDGGVQVLDERGQPRPRGRGFDHFAGP